MSIEETTKLIDAIQNTMNIDRLINRYDYKQLSLSFTDFLEQKLNEYRMKKSDVIRYSGLTRSYAYEVFAGFKKPSRDKVMLIALAIKLSYADTQKLLLLAGHNPLHPKTRRDAILIHTVSKGINCVETNLLLEALNEPLLE